VYFPNLGSAVTERQDLEVAVDKKSPLVIRAELIANEYGLLIGCLSWVMAELSLMKSAVQQMDTRGKEAKTIVGGEEVVEQLKRDVMGMVDALASLVLYQQECLSAGVAKFFDENPAVSEQDRDDFLQTIQGRIEGIQHIQDIKLKVDLMLQVLIIADRPQDSTK